jgi:hypothetical protein
LHFTTATLDLAKFMIDNETATPHTNPKTMARLKANADPSMTSQYAPIPNRDRGDQ